jgi:hypothetical protein
MTTVIAKGSVFAMAMETPWTRARKSKHELQEARLGQMEGGERQVNSGRLWRWKRDGKLHNFLIEARTTDKASYSISKEEFLKIRKEAFQTPPGLLAGMLIEIQDLRLVAVEEGAFQDSMLRLFELEALVEKYERSA